MALKDILLHMDNSPSCAARLDLAINLAVSHGARLKGLFLLSHSFYTPRKAPSKAEAEEAQALFQQKTARAGISSEWICADWTVVGISVTEMITLYAYYSDLVIVGQPDYTSSSYNLPQDLPERLGLAAGRPMLVVPYTGTFTTIERVMVAWKAGRESVRATHDAMPFLKNANHVRVVIVTPADQQHGNDENKAISMCSYLALHNVHACHEQILTASGFPTGDSLLNHAFEQKMDLLVMGAFARNRLGAPVLGPLARYVFSHMTLPVLISH